MQAITLYIKRVGTDYLNVFKDILLDSRQKPFKASFYVALTSLAYYSTRVCPGELDLLSKLAELRQEMAYVPNSIHSTMADNKLEELTNLCNTNRLRVYDCVFFSLVVKRPYDRKVCISLPIHIGWKKSKRFADFIFNKC